MKTNIGKIKSSKWKPSHWTCCNCSWITPVKRVMLARLSQTLDQPVRARQSRTCQSRGARPATSAVAMFAVWRGNVGHIYSPVPPRQSFV